jgi:predicted alternative tryptophan synthase beta-subunit
MFSASNSAKIESSSVSESLSNSVSPEILKLEISSVFIDTLAFQTNVGLEIKEFGNNNTNPQILVIYRIPIINLKCVYLPGAV